jgi:16S rRNA (cytidine1402-2'-O)-methyltransferase
MTGTLYVVATPIGNLEDITLRALRVLREVDLIACEDTRHTRKLLSHYQISKPTISYHAHNERDRARQLTQKLESGMNIALVSDAGTPLVSDPGHSLVTEAIQRGIPIVPLPGPSAAVTAVSACGLAADEFTFAGFLPSRKSARRARLESMRELGSTLVFYEAPHRINETLEDMRQILGERRCVIARELTKVHETFVRGVLSDIVLKDGEARGEMVIIIGPPDREQPRDAAAQSNSVSEHLERVIKEEKLDRKAALKRVARARGMSKSEAYRRLVAEKKSAKSEQQK